MQSLTLSMLVNFPGQAAAVQAAVQNASSDNIGEQIMNFYSNVGMAGPYRRLEVCTNMGA